MPSTRQSYLQQLNPPPSQSSPSPAPVPILQAPPAAASFLSPSTSSSQPSTNQQQLVPPSLGPQATNPLHQQWEFAAVWQFLFQFHKGLKSPFYEDIEEFARDLTSAAGTPLLHDVQIGLLKNVSSQRGLTIEMFDDYTRRQYMAKNPLANPFGTDPEPLSFYQLEPKDRVKLLHQLCMWILAKPEAFRDKVDPHKMVDNTDWRIDPIGWDSKGYSYYQFDNGYLYCRTEPSPPIYQKWKSRKSTGNRSIKRRKVSEAAEDIDIDDTLIQPNENEIFTSQIEWKCICCNLGEYRTFVAKFEKSKHPDEKELRKVILEDILPAFEKDEQKRKRKLVEEEKERLRLELLSGRKRSARVDERMARQREADELEQILRVEREERQRYEKEELSKRKEEQARITKLEERERRLQERELRAKQREEERARLFDPDATESEDSHKKGSRHSSRQKEKRKAELETEEKDWIFDCVCGTHGVNYDDGTYSIACDKCGVWQHTECLGLPQSAAEEEEFVCDRCRDKEKLATTPIKIKLRLTRPASSDGETGNNQTKTTSSQSIPILDDVVNNNKSQSSSTSDSTPRSESADTHVGLSHATIVTKRTSSDTLRKSPGLETQTKFQSSPPRSLPIDGGVSPPVLAPAAPSTVTINPLLSTPFLHSANLVPSHHTPDHGSFA
ncbi:hypothetical protein TWF694_007954 [Orbilia ellipsospora]|uniref:Zinc finger PHD-type domain-containing protein n=1 Tax=Orbilia ellipsospora TaxID=2528407 RepID=A0AAV9XJQ7_9PEZI